MPADSTPDPALPKPPDHATRIAWGQVALAALLMVATLPGRTQGLGLITEPLLVDLRLDRMAYANINLWATLLGAVFCLPAGWLLDRFGLRGTTTTILLLLGAVVGAMSVQSGNVTLVFILVLLTRALGQGALSIASITAVGKSAGQRVGMAMGLYSVLLSVFFAIAFVIVGQAVLKAGWRMAWGGVAVVLLLGVAPVAGRFLKNATRAPDADTSIGEVGGSSLSQAIKSPVFWVFSAAISLFGLVSSGLGLFNEAVLKERGFDAKTYHTFLAVTTLIALIGQFVCGWLSRTCSMARLLAVAMALYAIGLATLPLLRTQPQLWAFSAVFGFSGGMITVLFFAVWSHAFGRTHLGRIQGAAQMLTVVASAVGPVLFAKCHATYHTYAPILLALAPLVLILGICAWRTKLVPHAPHKA